MAKPRRPSATDVREQFDQYASQYHNIFSRADQREWFRLYMWGLLTTPQRKNVETIAAESGRVQSGTNLSQALQHFITDSPWDSRRLFARYRELLVPVYRGKTTAWVINDCAMLKKGRNSVGAQRQFARSVGKKVNCQLAVLVGMQCGSEYLPLAARLYLPGYWLREHPSLVVKTVPEDYRFHRPKQELACGLLDELADEGWLADTAVLDDGYRSTEGFTNDLATRMIGLADAGGSALVAMQDRFEWLKTRLGLDHFEGRTWVGWHHHVAMVFAAAGFLLTTSCEPIA